MKRWPPGTWVYPRWPMALLSLLAILSALCQIDVSADETVYVTKTGTKYHREWCNSLRSSRIPMALSKAAERYGPCKICKPPVPGGTGTGEARDPGRAEPSKPSKSRETSARCQATTRKGTQCSRRAKAGSRYCWQHQP